MKKFIRWLAKVFDAEITVERVVEVEKVVEKVAYLPTDGTVLHGDVNVDGNLVVDGFIRVTGGVSCKDIKIAQEGGGHGQQ